MNTVCISSVNGTLLRRNDSFPSGRGASGWMWKSYSLDECCIFQYRTQMNTVCISSVNGTLLRRNDSFPSGRGASGWMWKSYSLDECCIFQYRTQMNTVCISSVNGTLLRRNDSFPSGRGASGWMWKSKYILIIRSYIHHAPRSHIAQITQWKYHTPRCPSPRWDDIGCQLGLFDGRRTYQLSWFVLSLSKSTFRGFEHW